MVARKRLFPWMNFWNVTIILILLLILLCKIIVRSFISKMAALRICANCQKRTLRSFDSTVHQSDNLQVICFDVQLQIANTLRNSYIYRPTCVYIFSHTSLHS